MAEMKAMSRDTGKDYGTIVIPNGDTSAALSITPSIFSRQVNVSKAFQYFRFTKLNFTFPPATRFETSEPATTLSSLVAIGYLPEIATGSTNLNLQDVACMTNSTLYSSSIVNANSVTNVLNANLLIPGTTVPTRLNLGRKVLLSTPTRWFRCNSDSEDAETVQGQIFAAVTDAAGANTVVLPFLVTYSIEYSGRANSTVV